MAAKVRADHLLHSQGLVDSREKGKRLIMAGKVHMMQKNGQKVPVAKPGQQLSPETEMILKEEERFVSRGGYKLLTAIEHFNIDPSGKIALDAGASTGGFTDCLLQFGASKVYAVDVGYGQLHERMRQHDRVVCMEKVNLRHADKNLLPEKVDIITSDVSFISLTKILPPCMQLLKSPGEIVALIKPQFELGADKNVKGVVREESYRMEAVDKIMNFAREELGLEPVGFAPSSIKGPKGNQEYVSYFLKR